jgi:RNA polymerase sigma-70 factor (ECF subfamily)
MIPRSPQPAPSAPPGSGGAAPPPAAQGGEAELSDAVICRRVVAGETALYATLVARHQGAIFRVAAAMLGEPAAARAVVQQVFVAAYEHLDQYRTELPFVAWAKAIARNMIRKEALRAGREERRMELYRDFLLASLDESEATLARQARVDAAVRACREELGPAAARAIALRYDEGRPLEEVAAALERGLGATRQLLFRVRLALRDCLLRRLGPELDGEDTDVAGARA